MFPPFPNLSSLSFAPRTLSDLLTKVKTSPPDKYQIVKKISEGSFGIVFKAYIKAKKDAGYFALKTNRNDGKVTTTDYNEVKLLIILKEEKHIVKFIELVRDRRQFSLVLEYCIADLSMILDDRRILLTKGEKKNILIQLFSGLRALHGHKIMHRDLKPPNILLSLGGTVKISDFGNGIVMDRKHPQLCTDICTRWYKSPELILGYRQYDQSVDMWSAGCTAAEFYLRKPALFKGSDNDFDQMEKICELCGFCNESVWPEAKNFPNYKNMHKLFAKYTKGKLHKHLLEVTRDEGAANFLQRMLRLNAGQRITAAQALEDVYFKSAPIASRNLNHLLKALKLRKVAV